MQKSEEELVLIAVSLPCGRGRKHGGARHLNIRQDQNVVLEKLVSVEKFPSKSLIVNRAIRFVTTNNKSPMEEVRERYKQEGFSSIAEFIRAALDEFLAENGYL